MAKRKTPAADPNAPSLFPAEPPATDGVDAAFVGEYLRLERRRKDLAAQAEKIGRQTGPMRKLLLAYVDARCPSQVRTCELAGVYRLSVKQVRRAVAWSAEFAQRHSAKLIAELKAAAGTRDELEVESIVPPADAAAAQTAKRKAA